MMKWYERQLSKAEVKRRQLAREATKLIASGRQGEPRRKRKRKKQRRETSFYHTAEWKRLRYDALERSAGRCECCGASSKEVRLMVDHIKPISKFPHLKADPNNLQVLCASCNWGKSARFQTDWREVGLAEEPFNGGLPA